MKAESKALLHKTKYLDSQQCARCLPSARASLFPWTVNQQMIIINGAAQRPRDNLPGGYSVETPLHLNSAEPTMGSGTSLRSSSTSSCYLVVIWCCDSFLW